MIKISKYYKTIPLWCKTFLRSFSVLWIMLSIIYIISVKYNFFANYFKGINLELTIFSAIVLYCILLIIRILKSPAIIKTVSLTVLNYAINFIILNIETLFFHDRTKIYYVLKNSPLLRKYTFMLLQMKGKSDLVQLLILGSTASLCLLIGSILVTQVFKCYCKTTQFGVNLDEKIKYNSIFVIILYIVTLLFSAVVAIFYSKVIATLIGTLFLFLSHTIIKDILPILYELDHPNLNVVYESSILGKIILCIIDTFSAFLAFAYGIAQLATKKYSIFINVNKKSSLYPKIIKNINLSHGTYYIDHIQAQSIQLMKYSEENTFFLVFSSVLILEIITYFSICYLLKRDRKKFKFVRTYLNTLVTYKKMI